MISEEPSEKAHVLVNQPPLNALESWQRRLLPLMVRILVALILFFFITTCLQLLYLQHVIERGPTFFHEESWSLLNAGGPGPQHDALDVARLKALIVLEWASLERHDHQAAVLLMARVWINYLGFVTGMTLALVGAAFILGQLQASQAEVGAQTASVGLTLKTASPGVTLAFLGVILMLGTIFVYHPIETEDRAVFLSLATTSGTPSLALEPRLVPPRPETNSNSK